MSAHNTPQHRQAEDDATWPVPRRIASHARRAQPRGGHGHGHGHGHGGDVPVSTRTTRIVAYVLAPCAVITAIALLVLWPGRPDTGPHPPSGTQRAYGEVVGTQETPCPPDQRVYGSEPMPCGKALVQVTDGPGKGTEVAVDLPQGPGAPRIAASDKVILSVQSDPTGAGNPDRYAVIDKERGRPLVLMLALCAVVIVAFGRWRGLRALVGLALSFAVLLLFMIPAILAGEPPLLVAIVGSSAIMFAVLYLTHGVNVHTSVAILGTLASLVLTGLLGAVFIASTALTGFANEETLYLSIMNGNVDMRGLLLAGVIIGALGVLDDVTVTQSTTVAELAPSATSRLELYRAATRVGRAHVASAVNTIVLAYAGASLPLLLLVAAGGQDVSDLLTSQFLAQEIVRAAVGTLGLVAAVPITTGLAALVADLRAPSDAAAPAHRAA